MRDYGRALQRFDVEAIAHHYDLPCAVIRSDRTALVANRDFLIRELRKIADTYAFLGVRTITATDVEEVGFQGSLGIVNVTWVLRDARDALVTSIASTYLLRQHEDTLRIAGVVAHDEEDRRLPLVARESAAALARG